MSIIDNTRLQTSAGSGVDAHFPADFFWGVATSSYQIEGAAHEDGKGLSIWDQFAATPGKTYAGQTGEIADDHYHRMPEDVALMAELGINAYRFSLAWPRILPEGRGQVNTAGLDFYDRLVDSLLARNIRPFATLYHWDLPLELHLKGGWLNRDTAEAFAEYAEIVARRLGDRVQHWITLNELWCSAYLGYGNGLHAPGIQDAQLAVVAGHHLLVAHGLAMPRLRANLRPGAQLGITLNFTPVYAANEDPETLRGVERADAFSNRWFADPIFRGSYPPDLFADIGVLPPPIKDGDFECISAPIDFLGVNYYSRSLLRARTNTHEVSNEEDRYEYISPVPGSIYTETGWEVYPDGLTDLLCRLHRDYAPPAMLVTENGAAFQDHWDGDGSVSDPLRTHYLQQHITAIGKAREQGVPLQGYFVWSLLDNYEWHDGYSKRFGIVYIDYATQRRILKDSARWYASFLASQQGKRTT